MAHQVTFEPEGWVVSVPEGATVLDAAVAAGIAMETDCGGQGVCGRCVALVREGTVRPLDEARWQETAVGAARRVLSCQAVVVSDLVVEVPEDGRAAQQIAVLGSAEGVGEGGLRGATRLAMRVELELPPPTRDDSLNDLDRIRRGLRERGLEPVHADLRLLQCLPGVLRASGFRVSVALADTEAGWQLIDVLPLGAPGRAHGLAVDIGTTTVALQLVDLETGAVVAHGGERNAQVRFGDDVISRIVWSEQHGDGVSRLQAAVRETLGELIVQACHEAHVSPRDVIAASIAGNATMMSFLLGVETGPLRRDPHSPVAGDLPVFRACDLGLPIHPRAAVFGQAAVSGFVGADITAGVLATGMADSPELTLLVDVGTNGEIALGNNEWLVCCSCSAGPAFEGVGIEAGMHGGSGAIDRLAYDPQTDEFTYHVIGDAPPRGLCGTGFIDALATLFAARVIDRAGAYDPGFPSPRLRTRTYEPEFLLVLAGEREAPDDIALAQSDLDNLIRSKAAVHAGVSILLRRVGLQPPAIERILLAGAFGSNLPVEQAVAIGLLPDLPRERIHYVGNTSLQGALRALLSGEARRRASEIARRMTYIELSTDTAFMEEYMASMFLPHTDMARFPSVT